MTLLHALTDRPLLLTDGMYQIMLDVASGERSDPQAAADLQAERREALAVKNGVSLADTRYVTVRDGVAVIQVIGPMFRYANIMSMYSGGTSTGMLAQDFQAALDAPNVRAILFVYDSPGGEATGIHELSNMIYAARGPKPIWSYIGGSCASAAYWPASACDHLVIDATGEAGSIGAVMGLRNPDARGSRDIEIVSSQSPNKRPDVSKPEGRQQYQDRVDALADVFITDVAKNRGVSKETVLSDFGQGGMFMGQAAIDAGLVDELGSFEGTLAALRQKVQLSPLRRAVASAQETVQTMDLNWKNMFSGLFAAAAEAEAPAAQIALEAATESTETTQLVAADPAIQAELEQVRAQLAAAQADQVASAKQAIEDNASRFAADQVDAKRIFPAEQTALSGLHGMLAADDARDQGGRVAALAAFLGSRPAHQVAGETIKTTVVPLDATPAATEAVTATKEERRRKRLQHTPEGRAVLAKEGTAAA